LQRGDTPVAVPRGFTALLLPPERESGNLAPRGAE